MTVSRRAVLNISQAKLEFIIFLALGLVVNGGVKHAYTYSDGDR